MTSDKMAEGIVDRLKKTLMCRICANVLDDARVLKCGHMFCFQCIKKDYERQQLNKGNCPLCGENYFLKERNTQNLSKAFVVNELLDQLKSAVCPCAFCQNDIGTYMCLICKLNMCKHCSKRTTDFCGHQTVSMEFLDSDPFLRDIIKRSKSKQTCASHPDEDVSRFCQSCKCVICDACFNEAHRHDVVEILDEAVSRVRRKNIPHLLEKKIQELEKFLREVEEPSDTTHGVEVVIPTDNEKLVCQSKRDECAVLHRQMSDIFMYGNKKAILELFHEHESKVDKILNYMPENKVIFMANIYTKKSIGEILHMKNDKG